MVTGWLAWTCLMLATNGAPDDVSHMNQRSFQIPIRIQPERQADVKELILFMSRDQGKTWSMYARAARDKKAFDVYAQTDGPMWFNIAVVDNFGKQDPSDPYQAPVGQKLMIDTVKPDVKIVSAERVGEEIQVRWEVRETSPDWPTLKLEYWVGETPTGQPVPLPVTPGGQGTLKFKPGMPGPVTIQLQLRDQAGNEALVKKVVVAGGQDRGVVDRAVVGASAFEGAGAMHLESTPAPRPAPGNLSGPPGLPPPTSSLPGPSASTSLSSPGGSGTPPAPGGSGTPLPAPGGPTDLPPPPGGSGGSSLPPLGVAPASPESPGKQSSQGGSAKESSSASQGSSAKESSSASQGGAPKESSPASQGGSAGPIPTEPVAHSSGTTGAADGSGSQRVGALPPLRIVNKREVKLEFEVAEFGPSGLGAVDVYVTTDEGATWEKTKPEAGAALPASGEVKGQAPVMGSVMVQLPKDGVTYGFYLVVKSKAGLGDPPPKAGDPPQIRIEVDTMLPTAELYAPQPDSAQGRADALVLSWKAEDRNLATNPVSMEWSPQREGPWDFIGERQLPNTGRYTWQVPAKIPPKVYLRLTVRDTAGNTAVAQTGEPVLIDLKKPVIRNIRLPGASR